MSDIADILATPFVRGGMTVGKGIDCYGVTCELVRRRGWPPPDGMPSIREAGERGERPTGFPPGWHSLPHGEAICDGDVLLGYGERPWSAFVHRGHVVSANPDHGPFAIPLRRWHRPPSEVWRFTG